MPFDFLLLRQAILLAGCAAGAYTDARTGLIFDKITYPMIAAAILLDLIEWNLLFLAIGAVVFAIGYAVYYLGKIGGGDVKLFTAIAFLLPFYEKQLFLLNALFVAALFAVTFYAIFFVSRYARKGISWKENKGSAKKAAGFAIIIVAYLVALVQLGSVALTTVALLALPLALALLFMAFEHGIRRCFFLRYVKLKELDEDEVIAAEFLNKKTKHRLQLHLKGVFGKKEIAILRKMGVKKVPVYRDMPPFAPFVLLGCIAALAMPDLISVLFL